MPGGCCGPSPPRRRRRRTDAPMRLQVANPSEHRPLFSLPWHLRLERWPDEYELVDPGGLHRHVVRFYEHGDITYVLKELPEALALPGVPAPAGADRSGHPGRTVARRRVRPGRRGPGRGGAHHPPPRLRPHVSRAPVRPWPADPVPRRTAARLTRRPARPPAPQRVLLGGLLAVEHAVPARCGCARGVRHRRRDGRAPSVADGRSAAHRHRHRGREHRRRADRPAARRLPRRGHRPNADGGRGRVARTTRCGASSRPRSSSGPTSCTASTSGCDGCTNWDSTSGSSSSRRATTTANGCGSSLASSRSATSPLVWHSSRVCTPGRTRRAGCSTTSGGSGSSSKGATASASPRTSSPPGGSTRSTNRSSPPSRGSWPGVWSRPSSSTSCSSTAGSCPSRPARTSDSMSPGARTSTTSCATPPTSTS